MDGRLSYKNDHDACGIGAVIKINGVPTIPSWTMPSP